MSGSFWHIVVIYILVINQIEAAKILAFFPTPSISHQVVFRPLTEALAKRGHEVTVVTTDPAFPKGGTPPNLTEIDVHDLSYGIWLEEVMKAQRGADEDDTLAPLNTIIQTTYKVFDKQLEDERIQSLLNDKDKKFDLLLLECFVAPVLALSYHYKVPVIWVSSFTAIYPNYESVGAPTHPGLWPTGIVRKMNNLTMWERVASYYTHYRAEQIMLDNFKNVAGPILRKHFGPDVPPVTELLNNVDMMFLNIHPIFEGIRPVPPSVVYMSGLHQKPTKELPKVRRVDEHILRN